MKRLTYDFEIGGNHCWQVRGADNLECREVCERQGDNGCKTCPISKAFDRLAAIEGILCDGTDDYDLDRLAVMCNQRMSLRDEVSERFSLTAEIPLDRLREMAEAERDGRCVVLPRLEPGHGDNPGAPGVPGPPGIATEAALKAREQE